LAVFLVDGVCIAQKPLFFPASPCSLQKPRNIGTLERGAKKLFQINTLLCSSKTRFSFHRPLMLGSRGRETLNKSSRMRETRKKGLTRLELGDTLGSAYQFCKAHSARAQKNNWFRGAKKKPARPEGLAG
jgi:hypothetical protein